MVKSFQAHSSQFSLIKQSPFNGYVATCAEDFKCKVWDPLNNMFTLTQTYTGHTTFIKALGCLNADTIASGGWDSLIKIWKISTGQTLRTIASPHLFSA
jgi:WD40 repeat protein